MSFLTAKGSRKKLHSFKHFFVIFYSVWSLCIIENNIWWNNFSSLKIIDSKSFRWKKVKIKCARPQWDEYCSLFFIKYVLSTHFNDTLLKKFLIQRHWGVIFFKRQNHANVYPWRYRNFTKLSTYTHGNLTWL